MDGQAMIMVGLGLFFLCLNIEANTSTTISNINSQILEIIIQKYDLADAQLSTKNADDLLRSLRQCPGYQPIFKTASVNKTRKFNCIDDRSLTDNCKIIGQCLNGSDLEKLAGSQLDANAMESLALILLQQSHNKHCCQVKWDDNVRSKPLSKEVWGYGFLFVTLISLCSLVGVSVLPLMGKQFYKHLLTTLIGLAVGSLSGSSVFHLIPQAFNLVSRDQHHSYLNTSLMLLGGIWIFFMMERILKIIMDVKQRNDDSKAVMRKTETTSTFTSLESHTPNSAAIYHCQEQVIKASFGHLEKPQIRHDSEDVVQNKQSGPIATVAWMIIFGDGLHNFIDGLSIGAAFNESILTGVSISLAVICEEFPHELGDFAVLLNSGMKMRQAVMYNFLSACTCYMGMVLGILLGEIEASIYIFAFAGGMFLYISLVDMVPEMNEVAEQASKVSARKGFHILLLQNLGFSVGVFILYVLARYQNQIQF